MSWEIRKTYQHMHNSYIDQMLIVQGVQIASDQTTTTLDLEIGYSDQYL